MTTPDAGGLLFIRADAGASIGSGHVMRCIALAEEWIDRGGIAHLASVQIPDWLVEEASERGLTVESWDVVGGSDTDARRAAREAKSRGAAWIVVDGYRFGSDYQRRFEGQRLLVIDDHGTTGPYTAAAVLDQNLGADPSTYDRLAPGTTRLLGPQYALLRREFRRGPTGPPEQGSPRRVIASLGGTASTDYWKVVNAALDQLRSRGMAVDVLLGTERRDIPARMREADLAITAAGSTVWELCCLRVPMVLLTLADNQVPVATNLAAAGAAVYLGPSEVVDAATLAATATAVLDDQHGWRAMADRAAAITDGLGSARVVDYLLA